MIIRCRRSGNPSQQYNVPLVQQSDNGIKVHSTRILGNNGQKTPLANCTSDTSIPQDINTTKNTSTKNNVITILNTNQTHQLKERARIIDTLPGIINKFG